MILEDICIIITYNRIYIMQNRLTVLTEKIKKKLIHIHTHTQKMVLGVTMINILQRGNKSDTYIITLEQKKKDNQIYEIVDRNTYHINNSRPCPT